MLLSPLSTSPPWSSVQSHSLTMVCIGNPENIGTHFFFFATAIEKNVQQTVAAAMTIVTTCNFTFRSHPPLSRKPRLSIYTGDVLVTSSTVMLRTLKNGTAALGNHSFTLACGFDCVRFTLPGPHPIDSVKDNLVALHFKYDQARRRFVEWAQNEIAVVPDFHKRILFSDEAHFWLNGYGNKQNCRIWSEANPQVYVETPLHPEKLTVWCALWAGGIIGPYFFKNDEGHNVTVL
ncbi:hypothetical protein TNCV_5125401 [Trichonephila clavipes]|nr:hypothetical protein TNCV_5125401 [Trichonephila clavipes]